jgi:L-ascorbate metabolism protein UlaG (beta-lactamase superfamily)
MKMIILAMGVVLLGMGIYFLSSEVPAPTVKTTDTINAVTNEITMPTITPIDHASFIMTWGDEVIYNDPVGVAEDYLAHGAPTMIVITHGHPDHLDLDLLATLTTGNDIPLVAPQEVFDKLPEALQARTVVMSNGETKEVRGVTLTAVPMYNTSPDRTRYHVKGVGNGYVYEKDGVRIYNASDTELTDEFRAQTGMDIAFIPMNDPYTMSFDMAVEAALAIAPKQVYVYHYRGADGVGDVTGFKAQVEATNPEIEVVLSDWYPEADTEVVTE